MRGLRLGQVLGFDIVFFDVVMPGRTGIDLVQAIRMQ